MDFMSALAQDWGGFGERVRVRDDVEISVFSGRHGESILVDHNANKLKFLGELTRLRRH